MFPHFAAGCGVPGLRPLRRPRSRTGALDPDFIREECRAGRRGIPASKFNVAVMGCIVNGPGDQARQYGICSRASGAPAAPVFVDGKNSVPCAALPSPLRLRRRRRLHRGISAMAAAAGSAETTRLNSFLRRSAWCAIGRGAGRGESAADCASLRPLRCPNQQ